MVRRIIAIRKERGLSQEQFAKKIGLSRSFINQVETGKRNISDRTISDICETFNVSETWLRTGEGEMLIQKEPGPLDALLSELLGEEKVTTEDRILIKNFLELPDDSRKVVIEFVQKCAKELSVSSSVLVPDYEAEARAKAEAYYHKLLAENATEEEWEDEPKDPAIEAEVDAIRRQLYLQKAAEARSSASTSADTDTEKTA